MSGVTTAKIEDDLLRIAKIAGLMENVCHERHLLSDEGLEGLMYILGDIRETAQRLHEDFTTNRVNIILATESAN